MKKATRVEYDPFTNLARFQTSQSINGPWEELSDTSELLKYTLKPILFSNCAVDIVSIINEKQNSVSDGLEIQFVGPEDDFELLKETVRKVYSQRAGAGPLTARLVGVYSNAEFTLDTIRSCYEKISSEFSDYLPGNGLYSGDNKSIGDKIILFEKTVSDAIPICVIGNYSVGKSALLNALIGEEVLPSKENPSTAKNVEIVRSDRYALKLEYENEGGSVPCDLTIENMNLVVDAGSKNPDTSSLVCDGLSKIIKGPFATEIQLIREILDCLNEPTDDNKDGLVAKIGWNVVLELPFKNSLLSKADNKIIFFDTPGSDNAVIDKEKHTGALRDLMGNQTNALPVLVTSRDKLASQDVVQIKTMLDEFAGNFASPSCLIVISKCDQLTRGQLEEPIPPAFINWHGKSIILYVTPVGALGYRKPADSEWLDKNYEEHFERWSRNQRDARPVVLPDYNVYPCEDRRNSVKDAVSDDLFDTGIPCLENEILYFIEKYSKYKKCERGRKDLLDSIACVKERLSAQERKTVLTREESQRKKDSEKKRMLSELDAMELPGIEGLDHSLFIEFSRQLDDYCATLGDVMSFVYDSIPKDNPLEMDDAFNERMREHCQAHLVSKTYNAEGGVKQRIVEIMNGYARDFASKLQVYVSENKSHFSDEGSRMLDELLEQHKEPPRFNVPDTLLNGIGDLFEKAALGPHALLKLMKNDEFAKRGWVDAKKAGFEKKLRPSRSFLGGGNAGAFAESVIIPPLNTHYAQLSAWADDYRELIKGQLDNENVLLSGIESKIKELEAAETDLRSRLESVESAEEILQEMLEPHTSEGE